VTGAAGFIGSNLVDRLLCDGEVIVGYDNLSTGMPEFLASASRYRNFILVQDDLLDTRSLTEAMRGASRVVHLAANADVRFGLAQPGKDLEQNTIATFNVLEAMRANNVREIAFSSTGSIYGEAAVVPTPEDAPLPMQTSLYGASKLAFEGMIAAYAEGYGIKARIFRFVSILGQRYSHGHVFDFMMQLANNQISRTFSATASSVNPIFTSMIASRLCCSPSTRVTSRSQFSTWAPMKSVECWTASIGSSGG
jgi:UDP-glucose 4-epimerase